MIPRLALNSIYLCVVILLPALVDQTNGHGRLIEPPSRASAWRYGFSTPPNYNDHELYCGGYTRQWQTNGGKCGECGDAFDLEKPRPHEFGGKYGQGVITRKYKPGGEITMRVELTASHMGYFEFRVCDNIYAEQPCLDKHLLKLIGGAPSMPQPSDLETRFYPRNGSRIYEIRGQLPDDIKCTQCVLQWKYIAGNNWGTCSDGTGAVGCGPQEEFRACSDISVGEGGTNAPLPRPRPGTKKPATTKPTTSATDTNEVATDEDESNLPAQKPGTNYMGIFTTVFTLFLVLCGLFTIYLYHYHGQRIKQLLSWNRNKNNANQVEKGQLEQHPPPMMMAPPKPPPRVKRHSHSLRDINSDESSVLTGTVVSNSPEGNNSDSNTALNRPPECA